MEPWVDARYKPHKLKDHEMRVNKSLEMIYAVFYYAIVTVWGYWNFWGNKNIPK